MFNGAPMVTHELAHFVEELDRGDFSSSLLVTEMQREAEICLTEGNAENLQKRRTILWLGSSSA
jgi:hypothetical protein